MSRSIYAERNAALEKLLNDADKRVAEADETRESAMRHAADLVRQKDAMKASVDAERKKVDQLKELLLNAELNAAHLRGQLDRIGDLERRAATPMETRQVVVPYQPNGGGYYGGDTASYSRPANEKSWPNL